MNEKGLQTDARANIFPVERAGQKPVESPENICDPELQGFLH